VKTADFDYALPPELIAQEPLPDRAASRLLVLDRATDRIIHAAFRDLGRYLAPGDLLVLNDTKVIPARIWSVKPVVELLLVEDLGQQRWTALVKPGRRARPGMRLEFAPWLWATVESETATGERILRFAGDVESYLREHGVAPLPPYIKRPAARDELARVLEQLGQTAEAQRHYATAVRLRPDLLHARLKLGLLLARAGRFDTAREHLQAALTLCPTNLVAHYNLGAIHAAEGRLEPAITHFREVVRLNPADLDARERLARLLVRTGETEAAVTQYREGLRARSDWVEGLQALAWLLATSTNSAVRDGPEAVRLATQAAQLSTNRDPALLAVLDAAYAEAGRLADAIHLAQEARQAALAKGQTNLAEAAARRLEAYRAGRAFRE